MMLTRFGKIFLASSIILGAGCGVDAEDQHGRKLEKPTMPKDTQAFFLEDGEFDKTFNGSIIAWQNDVDADGVAGVALVSNQLIENGVATLKYISKEVPPLKAEFDQLYREVEGKTIEFETKSYELAAHAAATWLAGADGKGGKFANITAEYVKLTGAPLPEQTYAQAKGWFVAYCEAKLWERATNKNLIYEEYRGRRPTPSAMCEGVYLSLGLINPEAELCRADSSYRNFFSCLWHEGVKKTMLWQARYPEKSDAAKKLSSVSDEILKFNFRERSLAKDLLQQRKTSDLLDPSTGKEVQVDLTFQVLDGVVGPSTLSVQDILRNIEFRPQCGDECMILPLGSAEGEAKDFLESKNTWLREQITFFNKLSRGGYINENRFNRLFQKDSQVKGDIAWTDAQKMEAAQMFPEVFVVSNADLDRIKKELSLVKQKILAHAQKAQKSLLPIMPQESCPELPKAFDPAKPLEGSYACVYSELSKMAVKTVAPKSVSQAVWQGRVRIRRNADQRTLEVWVTPNSIGGQTHYGCTELQPQEGRYCPKQDSEAYGKAGIEIEEDTGYFNIWALIDDPVKSAMAESNRDQLKNKLTFSEIKRSQIKGNYLAFYVTLNEIEGVLTTLLGDAAIKSPKGETLIPASIKMREELPYFQALAAEYGSALKALQQAQ